jgi:SAM-dependent methyltransferase
MNAIETEKKMLPVRPKENNQWADKEEYILFLRHLASYHFALSLAKDKMVVDVGCGAGYGTNLMSKSASSVVGVDLSKDEIKNCKEKYKNERLNWSRASGNNLPFKEGVFDLCCSFQVIEHIDPKHVNSYLSEIDRILSQNATFIATTPNRELRLLLFQKPWNPEHTKEYLGEELREILEKFFPKVEIYGLYGNREVQEIEEKRVKQNPTDVYLLKPVHSLIRFFFPGLAKKMKANIVDSRHRRKEVNPLYKEKYSAHDFQIEERINRCIDLIAVCYTK